ncbi:MAG TPA: methyltransferase domain-containing protein [Thermoanaerobaculia bacterium]
MLLCTVRDCRTPLTREERRWVCERGHSFDVARSGYVNLLQPQDKKSKVPGDTAEAVNARRRFLDRGHTEPLVRAIVELVPMREGEALLDVGCGEGHHTAAFQAAYGAEAHGIDLSVPAIELAAKRWPDCHWIVANADRFLPYADASFHTVASITARLQPEEFRRVIRTDGTLLLAIAGPDDLIELRAAVQGEGIERDRVQRTIDLFAPRFTLERLERVRHVAHLERESIRDVLASSYRGLRTRERERLESLEAMNVTLARDLLLLRPS